MLLADFAIIRKDVIVSGLSDGAFRSLCRLSLLVRDMKFATACDFLRKNRDSFDAELQEIKDSGYIVMSGDIVSMIFEFSGTDPGDRAKRASEELRKSIDSRVAIPEKNDKIKKGSGIWQH